MKNYYAQKLNANKLEQVYNTNISRVRQYLQAEIDFVRLYLSPLARVLEMGAGYGRVLKELAPYGRELVGIDISPDSVTFGQEYLAPFKQTELRVMDAHNLEFEAEFDLVLGLQNSLSALKGDAANLIAQALKVLRPGGRAFFSTYSPKFWDTRLAWFQEQADKGLLGEIDHHKTGQGVIVCKDGFTATTLNKRKLDELGRASGAPHEIKEVDESSLFLILSKD